MRLDRTCQPGANGRTRPVGRLQPEQPALWLPSLPDLDCDEIGKRGFPVLPPDPDGFDGDGDRVECES